jgi:hypothetical protein
MLLVSEVGRKHVWYAVLNGIALLAGLTAELSSHYLSLILLADLKREISLA